MSKLYLIDSVIVGRGHLVYTNKPELLFSHYTGEISLPVDKPRFANVKNGCIYRWTGSFILREFPEDGDAMFLPLARIANSARYESVYYIEKEGGWNFDGKRILTTQEQYMAQIEVLCTFKIVSGRSNAENYSAYICGAL